MAGTFVKSLWGILAEGAPYILAGFALAGAVFVLFRSKNLARLFRGPAPLAAAKGVLFGAPLPICSCGVVPVSVALQRNRVPRSALMSFLISTPETGITSVLLTVGLIGSTFAWLRPAVAVVTALLAGVVVAVVDRRLRGAAAAASVEVSPEVEARDGAGASALVSLDDAERLGAPAAAAGAEEAPKGTTALSAEGKTETPWGDQVWPFVRASLRAGFVELLDDVAFWLVAGIAISALVAAVVPADFLVGLNPWTALLVAVLAGLPLYMCAASSTPVAMALLLKGLAPGAALVFLLVGPATNVGTIALLNKFFGKHFTVVYLATVTAVALAAGAALNLFGPDLMLPSLSAGVPVTGVSWPSHVAAALLAGLLLTSLWRAGFRQGGRELAIQLDALTAGLSSKLGRAIASVAIGFWRWPAVKPRRRLTGLGITALVLAAGTTCLVQVPAGFEAFVLRFGRVVGPARGPGWHAKLPWPLSRARVVPAARLLKINVGFHLAPADATAPSAPVGALDTDHSGALTLTADALLVELPFSVRFRTQDARRYHFGHAEAEQIVRALSEEAVRDAARTFRFAEIINDRRAEFIAHCDASLAAALRDSQVGVELLQIQLVDAHPPAAAASAFRTVSDAQEDKARAVEQAEARRISFLAETRGRGACDVAHARRQATVQLAESRGRTAALTALREAYRAQPAATRLRLRLETTERAIKQAHKWIAPSGSGLPDLWYGLPPVPAEGRQGEVRR